MFTIGIFSTHIPYVVFIAMYVVYLFFPSGLANSENKEIESDKTFSIHIQKSNDLQKSPKGHFYFIDILAEKDKNTKLEYTFTPCIKKWPKTITTKPQLIPLSGIFNRPPPVFS